MRGCVFLLRLAGFVRNRRFVPYNDAMAPVYLDNNATTRPAPEVVEAMLPFLRESFGNPSSTHPLGQAARHAVENARTAVAALINARPQEVFFTSGGTEADNLAILGVLAENPKKRHIVTTAVEHEAVLRLCQRLETQGYRVTWLGVDRLGRLDPAEFEAALRDDTALASVMHANNETGVIFPVERLAQISAARGVPLHVDAVQTVGKIPLDVTAAQISLLSLSAHKLHGPKGAGALYVRRRVRLRSLMMGGHQERDMRPGTENVAAVAGFGRAAELAMATMHDDAPRIARLRDRLEAGLLEQTRGAHVNGDRANRTPNTTNIGFETLEAEAIVITLGENGVCISAGAACASGSLEPSHVLKAMGIDPIIAHGGVRFSLSRYTTESEIDETIHRVPPLLERLRKLMPAAT